MDRLRQGERVVLYGPRGAGKSTLVAEVHHDLVLLGIPCGQSCATSHLDDITQALAEAYPQVRTHDMARRAARGRLWTAADHRGGVVLLDHVTRVNNAMVGFLRRLVGGIAGVLLVFDVDSEKERSRLRPGRLGALPLAMPLPSPGTLRTLWRTTCDRNRMPRLQPDVEQHILQTAKGRPGWIVRCAALALERSYWEDNCLTRINLLCADSEIALRFGDATLHELRRFRASASAQQPNV